MLCGGGAISYSREICDFYLKFSDIIGTRTRDAG